MVAPNIRKALEHLENANISSYFEEMDKVAMPKDLKSTYSQFKRMLMSGQAPWDFPQKLEIFAREVDKILSTSEQKEDTQGDFIGRDKIERQINMGDKSTYIENQAIHGESTKKIPAKQKILFLAASPDDLVRTSSQKEFRKIKEEMEKGSARDNYEFLMPELAITIRSLVREIGKKPNIVHFSGHGTKEGIEISTKDNQSQLLKSKTLITRIFKPVKDSVRLVLLNSCYSAEQAKDISSLGIYVIGNQLSVGSDEAVAFAEGIYIGLSEGRTVEEAFNGAMAVLETDFPDDDNIVEIWLDEEKLDL
ncbi:MAG: CHAT domain-containing protein [Bernardetiaceae bacterium]|nr:CHAT domain-containing protein [Bernardetiaceae bacterium]